MSENPSWNYEEDFLSVPAQAKSELLSNSRMVAKEMA